MLFKGLLSWPSPAPGHPGSGGRGFDSSQQGRSKNLLFLLPRRLRSRPHPQVSPTPPHLTPPHPRAIYRSSTLRLAKALARLGIHLIFRVIQKITGPLPSPVASGISIFFFFFPPCGVAAPILRIRANDGIVSLALPPQRSNLSSCSDRSSQERQDGGNNICSKEVNSSL